MLALPTLRSIVERYADRSAFVQQRARATWIVFIVGMAAASLMAAHQLVFGTHVPWAHVALDFTVVATLAVGLLFLARGQDELAALAVPMLTIVHSAGTIMDGLGPNPSQFFDGWVRWYPVYIAGSVLVGTPRASLAVTGISIGWTITYDVLFCRSLAPQLVRRGTQVTIESVIICALLGTLAYATIAIVQRALDIADQELQKSKRLADELEARVEARTRDLDTALAERSTVLDNLDEGLVALDPAGRIRVANPALFRLLSIEGELAGREGRSVLPPAVWSLVEQAPVVADIELAEQRIGRVAVSPLGTGRGVVALVRDVTLEREIDRMKTDFTSTVSHELRTPLTSVLGFAKIIKNRLETQVFPRLPDNDAKLTKTVSVIRGNVEIIVAEGERLTSLINDVLDISKMEAGRVEWKREPFEPERLVERAVAACSSLFHEGGPELRTDVAPMLPILVGDFDRLLQVIVNLISNAAKFTTEGHVTVSAQRTGDGVELAVTDTGPGIDPSMHAAVFEKFQQVNEAQHNKPKGTGLGLPISRQIVRAHHGEIRLESAVGQGSRFYFVLPREAPRSSMPPPSIRV